MMPDYGALFRLHEKTALVVGAGSGIGHAAALALSAAGAAVTSADVDEGRARDTAKEIAASGRPAESLRLDMTDPKSVRDAVAQLGAPDILVITPSINVRKRVFDLTDEEFDLVVGVNLKGTFRVVRDFGRVMAARNRGSIIAFSSIRAFVVEPGQAIYAATKAGILQLLRGLASELGTQGVRVNVIAPGVVDTPLTAPIKQQREWYEAYASKTMLGRWAEVHEMAGPVVFLASDASSYITGSCLFVDGGWTAVDGRYTPPL
jgi:NAD(P)-dependent dehydrogenase (short-subunit alcohol dehydrogenase family)